MNKPKSIAVNSIYYLIYQVLNVLYPFVMTLYAARILLPAAVGRVNMAQNIASYFIILSFLGIPTYGRREIAKARDDKDKLSKIYSELMVINTVSTTVFGIIYTALVLIVPQYRENLTLYLITGGAVALNFLNNSWLFEGLEEFKFISIRNMIFKGAAMVLLVLFVKGEEDYLIYAAILVFGNFGNYILNMLYAPKIARFTLKGLSFKEHLKPILALVTVNLAIELYSLVDVTMLGAMKGEKSVAYYTYAQGINKILQQVINTFTIVVVPRLALYYKEGKKDEFNHLVTRALDSIVALSLPMTAGIWVVADNAIRVFYGSEFSNSVPVLRLVAALVIISPIGYLLGSRILLVTGNENKMVFCVGAGAIVNIIGNFFFIRLYAEQGAALASVISEIVVMVVYISLASRYYRAKTNPKELIKVISATLLMAFAAYGVGFFANNIALKLTLQVLAGAAVYFGILYITKEHLVREYLSRISAKFTKM